MLQHIAECHKTRLRLDSGWIVESCSRADRVRLFQNVVRPKSPFHPKRLTTSLGAQGENMGVEERSIPVTDSHLWEN